MVQYPDLLHQHTPCACCRIQCAQVSSDAHVEQRCLYPLSGNDSLLENLKYVSSVITYTSFLSTYLATRISPFRTKHVWPGMSGIARSSFGTPLSVRMVPVIYVSCVRRKLVSLSEHIPVVDHEFSALTEQVPVQ